MGCMGTTPKQFYPSLMEMPKLTPEARQYIEGEAQQRLSQGIAEITSSEARLHEALAAKDSAAMQQAASGVRQGLEGIESGVAGLRALEQNQQPREIALAWFRGQLSLAEPDQTPGSAEPFGLSWYHLTVMGFLGLFVILTLLIHFARMRRVSELVARLATRPTGAGPPANPLPIPPSVKAGPPPSRPTGSTAPPSTAAPSQAPPAALSRRWSGALRVAAIFRETPDVKTFRLVNPQGGVLPFTFLPGQFITFSAEVEGRRVRRSYTIASSPMQTAYLEVTVRRQEHHGVSAYLHDRVTVGSLLDVSAASGRFTFTGEENSIVLIAGGVGITPMMSVIRYLIDVSFPGDIYFLFGARSTEDFIFREELEYLQRRHENLHVAATMSRAAGTAWMGPEGPITKEFIANAVPDIAHRHVHLCGPPPMMDAVKAALSALGIPAERVETEAFGPAAGMVPPDALHTDQPEAAPITPPSQEATLSAPPAGAAGNGAAAVQNAPLVRFTVSEKTGPLLPNQSVLEAAEAIGVDIDYQCRVGICGVCRVRLLEGAVTMEVQEGLEPGDKERGIILACQAKSTGNVVVEA